MGVVVIGAGAAGIAAARAAREEGAQVWLVDTGQDARGAGATGMSSGVVWGAAREPFGRWAERELFHRGGRYATVAGWIVADAQGALASLLDLASLPPEGMLGVVELRVHPSWSAKRVAETLGGRVVPLGELAPGESFRELASAFDTEGIAEGVAERIRAMELGVAGVLFPPVLGLRRLDVAQRMSRVAGVPVGEVAGGPGDPPGLRLHRALRGWLPPGVELRRGRARVLPGTNARVKLDEGTVLRADAVVLCTGGLAGGGLCFDAVLHESTAGAPVWTRARERLPASAGSVRGADPVAWFGEGGRAEGAGLRVDAQGRVLDVDGETPFAPWLYAAGDVVSGPGSDTLAGALAAGERAGRAAARGAR